MIKFMKILTYSYKINMCYITIKSSLTKKKLIYFVLFLFVNSMTIFYYIIDLVLDKFLQEREKKERERMRIESKISYFFTNLFT